MIRSFEFLTKEFGFTEPILWNLAYEAEHTYVNGQLYINIGFDGGFYYSIGKTREIIPELATGKIKITDLDERQVEEHPITRLVPKSNNSEFLLNGRDFMDLDASESARMNELTLNRDSPEYVADLLKKHPAILKGDFGELQEILKSVPGIWKVLLALTWFRFRRWARQVGKQ